MQVRALSCRIIAVSVSSALLLFFTACGGGSVGTSSKTTNTTPSGSSSPSLTVSASSLTFGNQVLNTASAGQSVRISNTGNAAASISNIATTGDFMQTNNCGSSVAAGSACTISVSFSPTAVGTRSGTLSVSDNAPGSPHRVSLSGNCVGAGQILVSPSGVSFGNVAVGSTSTQTVQLSNTGSGSVTISSVSTNGPGFSIKGLTVPTTLAANQKLSFNVSFSPGNAGTASGSVILALSVSPSSLTIPLTGTATTVVNAHSVTLAWAESSSGIVGYNIYRGTQSGGPFTRINASMTTATSYVDSTVASGKTYWYVVTSVANGNIESGYSNAASAVIPSP